MSEETKTLWGFPIVESDAMPQGTAIVGPLPTREDLIKYGSYEEAVKARAKEYAMITGLDDGVLDADVIE